MVKIDKDKEMAYKKIEEILWPIDIKNKWKSFWDISISKFGQFNPIMNSIHWAGSTIKIFEESIYAFINMAAYAASYKQNIKPGHYPSNVDSKVSYYADDCLIRMHTFRDKLALTILSLFDDIDPNKPVKDYDNIITFLKNYPIKNEPKEMWIQSLIKVLEELRGIHWNFIEKYRHLKIHRLEPRIEIYGVQDHHDISYLFKAETEKQLFELKKNVFDKYGSNEFGLAILNSCKFDGTFYSQKKVDRLFSYDDIETACLNAIKDAAISFTKCLQYVEAEISTV